VIVGWLVSALIQATKAPDPDTQLYGGRTKRIVESPETAKPNRN